MSLDDRLRTESNGDATGASRPGTDRGANGSSAVESDARPNRRREGRRDRSKDHNHTAFWRACRFLYPYRRIVAISITCALFVGAAFTGGLSTMLPIMQVLLKGDTVGSWANREVAERRTGMKFSDQDGDLRVVRVKPGFPAAAAGIAEGFDKLDDSHRPFDASDTKQRDANVKSVLTALSDPARTRWDYETAAGQTRSLALEPVPWYQRLLRNLAARVPEHPVKAIASVFSIIATLAVVSNVVKFFQEYLSDKAAVLAIQDIRRRMYDHVLHVPMSHFGSKGTSDVTSRLTQDSQELAQGYKTVLGQTIQEPIKAAFAFGLALWVSWKLTLFIVVFAPVMFLIIKKLGKKMGRASRKALMSSASMLGQIEGTLIGIRVVKGASAERFERRRYSRIMQKLVHEQLRMSRIDAFSAPTMETLTLFVVGSVVLFAAHMVLVKKSLPIEDFILVMACLGGIGDSLRRLSKVNNVLQKSNSAATRIFEVMDLPVEGGRVQGSGFRVPGGTKANGQPATGVSPANGASLPATDDGLRTTDAQPRIKLRPLQKEVRFENLTFSYPNATTPALHDVSLTVPKGQSVAIVGRNGSGKTTLLALLPRFYDPQSGRVLIDGVDLKHATLRSLRGQISIVTQDSVIFPGTIAENIAYGDPLADRADIEAAARRAFAHDFILEKPQAYDTMLGELGGQLSGGQKQRVCIARAIFRQAPILVLDEATSQVDAESEHLIQQAIESLMHERTTFVIAHRFSTILSADTIVVMDRGRIVGQGKHEELLRTCETYQQLYERQLFAAPAASVG